MAFKKSSPAAAVPNSPEELFLELSGRKHPNVLLHQGEILRAYSTEAITKADVSIELPTGSGKTLVGLLIAEWRRQKFNEKVIFLCPTKQLVNQVVEEARNNYGLDVVGYTGSIRNFSTEQHTNYKFNNAVCVTTYSHIFNTKPYFKDADVLILDDAHASENYVGKYWSLAINRNQEGHDELHSKISALILPYLRPADAYRLQGKYSNTSDNTWVDKLPTRHFNAIRDNIHALLEEYAGESDLKHAWRSLKNNFHACHLFLSSNELLIRPTLYPTWDHAAFSTPKQRLYMSATLSRGGDLERTVGREKIYKINAPDSFKLHGIGRRFFMFPDISLDANECTKLIRALISKSGRALYLVPSNAQRDEVVENLSELGSITIYTAEEIEKSKSDFVEEHLAAAVLANRYDGIDFRGDACRLLLVEGLPRAMSLNERFLMDRMAASIIFSERVQTRVIQAVGRCTRSLEDYSAVVILGEDIPDYLINDKNTRPC